MGIARFITTAGLIAGCALMVPIALGAIAEVLASLGAREMRNGAQDARRLRIASLPEARLSASTGPLRSAKDAA